jgi:hypothetical protein
MQLWKKLGAASMPSPDPEHLKFIQGIIARLAGNSFLLKGWSVTLVAGLTALAKADSDRDIAWIAVGVVIVFGLLDAYYLANERSFRKLYRDAVAGETAPWSLNRAKVGPIDLLSAAGSFSVWVFYGAAAVGAALIASGI